MKGLFSILENEEADVIKEREAKKKAAVSSNLFCIFCEINAAGTASPEEPGLPETVQKYQPAAGSASGTC